MIKAEIIADSVGAHGSAPRLTTMVLTYPRWIHAELLTHRSLSRNASSSRAIPVKKMLENIRTRPAAPIHWGKNKPGMQSDEELTGHSLEKVQSLWAEARESALMYAELLAEAGAHKQLANRLIENHSHMVTLVTATDWDNFYALRNHPDAQPEIKALAEAMLEAHNASEPRVLNPGEWHVPFVKEEEYADLGEDTLKVSAARCARVSYLKHDGQKPNVQDDLALFERLMGGSPIHASPAEHQAQVPLRARLNGQDSLKSNLRGWIQFRKTLQNETIYHYPGLMRKPPLTKWDCFSSHKWLGMEANETCLECGADEKQANTAPCPYRPT